MGRVVEDTCVDTTSCAGPPCNAPEYAVQEGAPSGASFQDHRKRDGIYRRTYELPIHCAMLDVPYMAVPRARNRHWLKIRSLMQRTGLLGYLPKSDQEPVQNQPGDCRTRPNGKGCKKDLADAAGFGKDGGEKP